MAMNLELILQPIIVVVAIPLVGALLAAVLACFSVRFAAWVSALVGAATLLPALALFGQAWVSPISFHGKLQWWPFVPAPPNFYADVPGAGLVVLVAFLALCLLASSCERTTAKSLGRGHSPLSLATLGATIALILSQDLLTFYACWEMMTVCAVLTVATRNDERSGAAATRLLLSSILLSTLTSFAIVWAGWTTGSFEFASLGRAADSAFPVAGWLIAGTLAAAALFRCGVLPFHVWMGLTMRSTRAHAAQMLYVVLPASGFLALTRLVLPNVPLPPEWNTVIAALGTLTALSGSAAALRPKDSTGILAHLCVGQAGFVAVGLAVGNAPGVAAAAFQLFGPGVSLTLLCLVIARYRSLLGGMSMERWREAALSRPYVFAAIAIAFVGTGGFPPFGVFGARELLASSLLQVGSATSAVLLAGVVVATALGAAAIIRLGLEAEDSADPIAIGAPDSRWDRFPVLALAAASVLVGFSSHWLSSELFARFGADAFDIPVRTAQTAVAPWTIPTSAALLFASLAAGVLIYAARSDSEGIATIPLLATTRRCARRLSIFSPVARGYWKLADKGVFDVYPAISSLVNGFARAAAFVVYVSAGRGAR